MTRSTGRSRIPDPANIHIEQQERVFPLDGGDRLVSFPAALIEAAAELLGTVAEREHAAEERGYRAGWAGGYVRGRADELATHPEPLDVDEPAPWPAHAPSPELDRLRYPPHGRKRFAEARPGDFPGRRGRAA